MYKVTYVLNVFSQNHLIVLMLLVFEATVYRHQTHHYRQLQRSPPTIPALFPAATRDTLNQGLIPCFKYLLNYTFYKFGLEVVGRANVFVEYGLFGLEVVDERKKHLR